MAIIRRLSAAIACIGLLCTLSACSEHALNSESKENTSPRATTKTAPKNDAAASDELSTAGLTHLENIPNPPNETGKVAFTAYKAGIIAALESDGTDPDDAEDKSVLFAYAQCLAAKSYPHISAEYAAVIASKDIDKLVSATLSETDTEIFDRTLSECLSIEQH
ncbi:hypothetical protein [Arcanobacterium hippocoleae]|uniref:hypothetical protein n=1 Tax=Arcanobacterium hippocoleae TaxID=149017 RepID=UPI00333FA918